MDSAGQDLRYSIRTLFKSPRFSVAAVLTLALGIAANVAIFAFVNAALIRPLPYRDSARLIEVYSSKPMEVNQQFEASYPDFVDWRKENHVFENLAGFASNAVILKDNSGSQFLPTAVASDNFFQTLGVRPLLGRDFRAGEDLAAAPRTVLLSYAFWQNHFGGRRDVIGETLNLDGKPNTIIGVLPRDFQFAPVGDPQLWLTLHAEGQLLQRRNLYWVNVIGRLKPGVSRDSAAAAMNVIAEQLERQYPDSNQNLRTALLPLTDVIVGSIRPILLVLLASVTLLLLVACANVANLLLARSVSRRRELAIRTALGASRARIVWLMLSEGLALSLTGGILGALAAQWLIKGLVLLIPQSQLETMPYLQGVKIDGMVLGFALFLAIVTGIVFALAPALQASRANVQHALNEGSRSSHSGLWKRFASGLVVAEVTVAMVLLVGSGLLIKSVYRLLSVDAGFDEHNLVGMAVGFPDDHYPKEPEQIQLHRNLMQKLSSLPGVESVGSGSVLPVSNGGSTIMFCVAGQPCNGRGTEANIRSADRTYLQTLRAQLVAGRWFNETDTTTSPQVLIVNETLARKFLNGDPLKQQIRFTYSAKEKPRHIIGVVRDIKEGPLDSPARPAIYDPIEQSPRTYFDLAVRSPRPAEALIPELKAAIHNVDPDAVTFDIHTMQERIQLSPATFLHRYPAWLATGFAMLALLLGSIGLYGVIAYSVSQRTQEIGIRMALGAQRGQVLSMVLSQGLKMIVPGIVIGALAAIAAASLVRSMLFGVTVADPLIFAAVTAILAAVTSFASFIPARQATKVDPMVALRYE